MNASQSRRLARLEARRNAAWPSIGFIVRDGAGHIVHTTAPAPLMIEIAADDWRL
jgi:hypothetical protein